MGLPCASCGHDNDPTRIYCHSCGALLERGTRAAPSGFSHPTDIIKARSARPAAAWGAYLSVLVRVLVAAALFAAVVLALLPPRDLPAPAVPDKTMAERLTGLIAVSASAAGTRAFTLPAADLNTWLASSVELKPPAGAAVLRPERVYAVAGDGDVRLGLEASLAFGPNLYFEGRYAPVAQGGGQGLVARGFCVGRLPLPGFAGLLVRRQFATLGEALATPLGYLARASQIAITPETVSLRWSGQPR